MKLQAKPEPSEDHIKGGKLIREVVYGFQDGIVTVIGIVAGVSVLADFKVTLLAAIAGLLGEAISMGLGGYISTKSQNEFYEQEIEKEKHHLEKYPEWERKEVREFYAAKGFKGKQLNEVVKVITSSKKHWLNVMIMEEFGFPKEFDSPKQVGVVITGASVIGGIVPILPFLPIFSFQYKTAFIISIASTIILMFIVGSARTKLTKKNWFLSGMELTAIGVIAATAAYFLGRFLNVIF